MARMKSALLALAALTGAALAEPLPVDAITFNIRHDNPKDGENAWPERKAMVGEWLTAESPDVVGLQEALRHQIDDLLKSAPTYAEFGVGRDDGKSKGEHCTILYKAERFEPGEGGTFWLSDTPEKIASKSWGNGIPRICTWLHLTDKATKRGVYVYNVHWDHRSQPSRERAAELINERILARTKKDDPVILMGDFNAAEDNPAIATLKKHFVDTFRIAHPDEKFVNTFGGFKPIKAEGRKIDHVFIQPDSAEVKSATIDRYGREGRTLSDHFPVRAKLVFP